MLPVIAGYYWLSGTDSCAFCAQFVLVSLGMLLPVAATIGRGRRSSAGQQVRADVAPGAASYARYSSHLQDERSITDQQRRCRESAEKDGFVICPELEFSDDAQSGAKHTRQGFDDMLAAARQGRIKDLYLYNSARMARDCLLTLQTFRELVDRYKIRIVSISEGLDTSQNPNWELLAMIFGWQNEQYLKNLADQVFRGLEGLVLDGYCVGDHCFGYRSQEVPGTERKNRPPKKAYAIYEPDAEWVRRIFHWFVRERRSLRWIARELNLLGSPKDHRATTKEWKHQYLPPLMKNRKYIGHWPWGERQNVRDRTNGKTHQEQRASSETEKWLRHFPELRIIDDETYAEAQQLLARNAEKYKGNRASNGRLRGSSRHSSIAHPRHLLAGLVACGHCGRRFHVGGKNGKYLFCPGYHMGVCDCQTQLRRDLAEKLILEAIGERIFSNSNWSGQLLENACTSFDKQQRDLPSELQATEKALAEVERKIKNLMDNAEEGRVHHLEERYAQRRSERDALRARLEKLQQDSDRHPEPPTKEWIESQLADLWSLLQGRGPAAAHALRALVGGKIVVTEVRLPGMQRHYLRGRMDLKMRHCIEAMGAVEAADCNNNPTELIVIDFRKPPRSEEMAGEVKRLWDEGMCLKEICKSLNCSNTLVQRALDHWYRTHAQSRPDGRACKKRLKGHRKADRLKDEIMRLFDQDMPVLKIAEKLGCCAEIVREAVENWHTERGLPIPDGRTRRREIREKKKLPEA